MPELLHDLNAVDARKHDVKHDRIIEAALGGCEACVAVIDGLGVEMVINEDLYDRVREVPLVLDNKNVHALPPTVSCIWVPDNTRFGHSTPPDCIWP